MPEDGATPEPAQQAAPPTLTQDEVNRLVGNARVEARTALLKKLGVESEDAIKTAIEERDALKAASLTEAERSAEEANKWKAKYEESQSLITAAQLSLLRAKVGREKGLPEPLIERLQGTDEDTLAAEVDALLPFLKGSETPPNIGGGTVPPSAGNGLSPDEQMANILVDALSRKGG